jgi:Fe-S-cluster containining protein
MAEPTAGAAVCRSGCGACCIAASISSPIPGMPDGKRAGEPCVQLTADYRCAIWGRPERPACCAALRPGPEICGASRDEALQLIAAMEQATTPAAPARVRVVPAA